MHVCITLSTPCSHLIPYAPAAAPADTSQAAKVVKQAVAKANSVPAPAVLSAMLDLEAAKLPVSPGLVQCMQAWMHQCTRSHTRAHTSMN
jgi:hypothetical protein